MPSGLMLWNSNGALLLGPDTPMGRILGRVTTTTVDGGIVVPEFALGTPFIMGNAQLSFGGNFQLAPRVFISGTSLLWTFQNTVDSRKPMTVTYGVTL